MTGTSVDGVDIALVKYDQGNYHLEDFCCRPFPKDMRQSLLLLTQDTLVSMSEIARLHFDFARFVAHEVISFLGTREASLISFPGQTVYHSPENAFSFQLGSPGVVASLTGTTTVGDFRSQDIALGGEGAPLVPFVDALLWQAEKPRILLNIGGIANLTYLPAKNHLGEIVAFDTGPGNMLLDEVCEQFYQKSFDYDGKIASSGQVQNLLLEKFLSHPYLQTLPPKSTGREIFGKSYLRKIMDEFSHIKPEDFLATVCHFTVESIAQSIEKTIPTTQGEIIVSGGGAYNSYLIHCLKSRLEHWHFVTPSESSFTAESKEAFAFAILAHYTLKGEINHLPKTTGCPFPLVLGSIYQGRKKIGNKASIAS